VPSLRRAWPAWTGAPQKAPWDNRETPIQAREEASSALTADGGGADAKPGADGTQIQVVGQEGLDDRTVVGGQLPTVTTHRATPQTKRRCTSRLSPPCGPTHGLSCTRRHALHGSLCEGLGRSATMVAGMSTGLHDRSARTTPAATLEALVGSRSRSARMNSIVPVPGNPSHSDSCFADASRYAIRQLPNAR